jgi:hypothetical protein
MPAFNQYISMASGSLCYVPVPPAPAVSRAEAIHAALRCLYYHYNFK